MPITRLYLLLIVSAWRMWADLWSQLDIRAHLLWHLRWCHLRSLTVAGPRTGENVGISCVHPQPCISKDVMLWSVNFLYYFFKYVSSSKTSKERNINKENCSRTFSLSLATCILPQSWSWFQVAPDWCPASGDTSWACLAGLGGGEGQLPPRVKILRAALCSLLIVRSSAQFSVDSQTVNIRRTISIQSSDKDRNMIKTCLADNVHFHVKQNLCYKDLLIKDNELPPYLPKGIY